MRPDVFHKGQKATRYGMIDFGDPRPEQIDILDIAHQLAHSCRYGGACRAFFSVAEHSVNVSRIVESQGHGLTVARQALMHDAAEAYVADLPSPLKRLLPKYCEIEDALLSVIFERFDLALPLPKAVKTADMMALRTEAERLMEGGASGWGLDAIEIHPLATPVCMGPEQARDLFLHRASELGLLNHKGRQAIA